jgi:hypothetical protein
LKDNKFCGVGGEWKSLGAFSIHKWRCRILLSINGQVRIAVCWMTKDITGSVKKYSSRGIVLYRIDKWNFLIFRRHWLREAPAVATFDDPLLISASFEEGLEMCIFTE